jgi:ABC-type branched-subunit amino acid transport system ATPase component
LRHFDVAMLETHDLSAFYGDFQALFGITFTLEEGETVAIIGANGAGKSTFLKTVAGLLRRPAPAVRFDNRDIGALPAYDIVKLGIALVPEGRRLFSSLSVEEPTAAAPPAPGTCRRFIGCFPSCTSAVIPRARPSPAASNRWSRSGAA